MKNFFQSFLGSCLGVLIGLGLLFFIGGTLISKLVMSQIEEQPEIMANSVLKLNFDSAIPEKTNNTPVNPYSFENNSIIGLSDIVKSIEKAGDDDKIKGIYLKLSSTMIGRATASSLHRALLDFKQKGKFVVAYSDGYSQGAYYLASASDDIYLNPIGEVDFRGFGVQLAFFKKMLTKLGIKMQIFYAGQFKSATEPFRLDQMSEQNRLQVREYLEDLYGLYLVDIAKCRNIPETELRRISDNMLLREAEDALQYQLVDQLAYEDEALDLVREKLGVEADAKISFVNINKYAKGLKSSIDYKIKDKIAVVFAEGEIVDGQGEAGMIGGDRYVEILRKVRRNDRIKAVVLRVNSPGGSALASDKIWREVKLLRDSGRPVIVSMGDLAASGGYYISCAADTILAESGTITGSIGVFSLFPSLEEMLEDKAGITFDTVTTGRFSIGLSPFSDLSTEEMAILQASTERLYEVFLRRVADGRKMSRDEVHEVAQGRIWTGNRAKKLHLVDGIGDLDDALDIAARMAGLDAYRTAEYPKTKEPLEQLIDQFANSGGEQVNAVVKEELQEVYPLYKQLSRIRQMKGAQARLPFFLQFD